MMPEYMAITIKIPRKTWEIIQRSTAELQGRVREQGWRTPYLMRMCMRRCF